MKARDAMPDQHRVVKFFPSTPPSKGEVVLVDGERCRVTKVRVRWDGPRWRIHKLKVRPVLDDALARGGGQQETGE